MIYPYHDLNRLNNYLNYDYSHELTEILTYVNPSITEFTPICLNKIYAYNKA